MADYRLECCGGYPGHDEGCPVLIEERKMWTEALRRTKEKKAREEAYWSSMSDEQVFQELNECKRRIKEMQFWIDRNNSGTDYLRKYGKITAYLDSLRSSEAKG